MGIDAKRLTKQLTIDDYRKVAVSLGATVIHENDREILFTSICHERNPDGKKNKLYFYKDKKIFLCYICDISYSVYSLVQKRKKLSGEEYTFPEALQYVCDVCNIPYDDIQRIHKKSTKVYNWEDDLSRYIRIKNGDSLTQTYDKAILDFFPKIYHTSFLNDGISIQTMEMFGIRFYPYAQQIVIPVFDENGELVGLHGRNLNPELVETGYKYLPVKLIENNAEYRFNASTVLYGLNWTKANIENTKEAILFEAPKSVMQMEDILTINNTVGMFGMNLQNAKRNKLIQLGVEKIGIALDKQYHTVYDDNGELTEEYVKWKAKVNKIIDKFKGFVKEIYVIYDDNDKEPLLSYKDSPSDKGKEVWEKLYEKREIVEQ